jgi:hemolysin activation/secretion protein
LKIIKSFSALLTFLLSPLFFSSFSVADDAGSIQRSLPVMRPDPFFAPHSPEVKKNTGAETGKFFVSSYSISGNELIDSSTIKSLIQSYTNREISIQELSSVKSSISDLYRSKGYFARAIVPQQSVTDGVVKILVVEARLGKIRVDDSDVDIRFPREKIRSYVERGQKTGAPISIVDLENAVSDLDAASGIAAQAILNAGERPGETDIVVMATSEPLLNGSARLDNHGTRSSGNIRSIANVSIESPLGGGERVSFLAIRASGLVSNGGVVSYPIGTLGIISSLAYSKLRYDLGEPVSSLEADGGAETYSASLSVPVVRGVDGGTRLRVDATRSEYINRTAAGIASEKNIDQLKLDFAFDYRDALAGGGFNLATLSPTIGRLDLSRNADDLAQDEAGPRRNGSFFKVAFDVGRLQTVSKSGRVKVSVTGQKAFKNLDSAEKLSIGGPQAVRAYPSNEAAGDTAVFVQSEYKHYFSDIFNGSCFFDMGWVKVDQSPFSADGTSSANTPNTYTLKGAGVGLRFVPVNEVEFSADLGVGLGGNPGADASGNDSDGTKPSFRFWLQVVARF